MRLHRTLDDDCFVSLTWRSAFSDTLNTRLPHNWYPWRDKARTKGGEIYEASTLPGPAIEWHSKKVQAVYAKDARQDEKAIRKGKDCPLKKNTTDSKRWFSFFYPTKKLSTEIADSG
ncbi:MAG: hypothetical protein EB060_07735 [Proteobacteria bacterium]|nr:hypothetical protein [Pseudomonadota bacterium]